MRADIEAFNKERSGSSDNLRGTAEVRAATSIPIALGESAFTRFEIRDAIDAGAVDVVQPDAAIIGGGIASIIFSVMYYMVTLAWLGMPTSPDNPVTSWRFMVYWCIALKTLAVTTAAQNAAMRSASFTPGADSTPLLTSTAYGRTRCTAAPTVSGVRPPARNTGRLSVGCSATSAS